MEWRFALGTQVQSRHTDRVGIIAGTAEARDVLGRPVPGYQVDWRDGSRSVAGEWTLRVVTDADLAAQAKGAALQERAIAEIERRRVQEVTDGGYDG